MCGILVTSGINEPFHHRLLRSLKKRGPDEIGFWSDRSIQMAHARLSIIGLDDRGTEPLENERHVLIYNGEIYNFHDIKNRLNGVGVPVTGANDAEVLLNGWTQWGPEVLKQLTGFWAFVIYDKEKQTLSLVRDQVGVKPLYYWIDGTRVCISSLLKTILEVTKGPRELDYTALSEYVRYQFTFGDKTFIKGIRKVMPGHIVEIDLRTGETKDTCYEDIFAPVTGDSKNPCRGHQANKIRALDGTTFICGSSATPDQGCNFLGFVVGDHATGFGGARSHLSLSRSRAWRMSATLPFGAESGLARQYDVCGNTGRYRHFGPAVTGTSSTPLPNNGRSGPPNGSPGKRPHRVTKQNTPLPGVRKRFFRSLGSSSFRDPPRLPVARRRAPSPACPPRP